jgi:hypothetical protein
VRYLGHRTDKYAVMHKNVTHYSLFKIFLFKSEEKNIIALKYENIRVTPEHCAKIVCA